jgi:alkanesulfonate monooxygenase SsuD/methylene tetrahydromethanopterin reductase-like flavin-dependent oxidoreductase (luciferase family)
MVYTESAQVPWMMIAAAAPSQHFATGIAVAFPRSPMMSAQIAWELAQNTQGRFRLGLGSQVKAHIERRYAAHGDRPAPQMRDYLDQWWDSRERPATQTSPLQRPLRPVYGRFFRNRVQPPLAERQKHYIPGA